MNVSRELLEKYIRAKGVNQRAIADEWSVTETYVSRVLKGRGKLSDERIIELAEALGEDPAKYLIQVQAEKAKTPKERDTWLKLLGGSAACFALALPVTRETFYFALCISCGLIS